MGRCISRVHYWRSCSFGVRIRRIFGHSTAEPRHCVNAKTTHPAESHGVLIQNAPLCPSVIDMEERTCTYCIEKFRPSRYHPDQQVCSSGDCQRRRRTDYHRKKLVEDPVYREQCRDSQQKWREKNPHYMKRYWAKRRTDDGLNAKKSQLASELNQLLKLVKNNSAVDLRSLDASIWLVSPDGLCEKNNLASAKIIIVLGIPSSSG
jgi:hypothetical protein